MLIQTKNNVPDIYTTESRDFQLLEAIFDIVTNSIDAESRSIKFLRYPAKMNSNLLKLLCTYEGFFTDLYYPEELLRSILLNFPYFIKMKGTEKAMQDAVRSLQNAYSNRVDVHFSNADPDDPYAYILEISGGTQRVSKEQIEDVLRYVKPVGIKITNIYVSNTDTKTNKTLVEDVDHSLTLHSEGSTSDVSNSSGYLYGQIRKSAEVTSETVNISNDTTHPIDTINYAFPSNVLSSVGHTPITRTRSFVATITEGDLKQ